MVMPEQLGKIDEKSPLVLSEMALRLAEVERAQRKELGEEVQDRKRSTRRNGVWAAGGLFTLGGLATVIAFGAVTGPIGWAVMGFAIAVAVAVTAYKGFKAVGAMMDADQAQNARKASMIKSQQDLAVAKGLDLGDVERNRDLNYDMKGLEVAEKAGQIRQGDDTHGENLEDRIADRAIKMRESQRGISRLAKMEAGLNALADHIGAIEAAAAAGAPVPGRSPAVAAAMMGR